MVKEADAPGARARGLWRAVVPLIAVTAILYALGSLVTPPARVRSHAGPDRDWNVLVVSFDTTRVDRLGVYGDDGASTPVIDALAARGTRFTRCFAPTPMTLPSHASLLTGLYPFRHQLRANRDGPLHVAIPTLAEAMRARGRRTGAVVASAVLAADRGLSRGFDHYSDVAPDHDSGSVHYAARRADAVSDAAIDWLDEAGASPWFLWAHYYDPHVPYDAPGTPPDAALDAAYDREISYADAQLGRLLDRVAAIEKATDRPTAVVFTADHGEALGEHDESTHGLLTYNGTIHVPLIVIVPGHAEPGTVVREPVSLVDVAPTITSWFDRRAMRAVDGRPILDPSGRPNTLREDRAVYFESVLPKRWHNWSELRGAVVGDWKLILAPQPELYQLARDLRESNNLHDGKPEVVTRLRDRYASIADISELLAQYRDSAENLAPEQRRELESLGYLGDAHALDHDADAARDPKEFVYVHELYVRGRESVAQGRFDQALRQFESAFGADPDNPQLIQQFVRLLNFDATRARAGEILLKRLAETRPLPDPLGVEVRVQLAIMMGRAERFVRAEQLLSDALALDPDDRDANFYYAHALLMQGKSPRLAQPYLDKAGDRHGNGI